MALFTNWCFSELGRILDNHKVNFFYLLSVCSLEYMLVSTMPSVYTFSMSLVALIYSFWLRGRYNPIYMLTGILLIVGYPPALICVLPLLFLNMNMQFDVRLFSVILGILVTAVYVLVSRF